MRQTMKDKGFPASLQPGPNNLIRVLIGPYTDKQSLGRRGPGFRRGRARAAPISNRSTGSSAGCGS
jgi:hypothetical protein